MTCGLAWGLAGALTGGGLAAGTWLGAQLRRAERFAEHAESERAWTVFGGGLPHALIPDSGEEFYCRCGRREVVAKGSLPPTCWGVSCVGSEHPPRVMRGVEGP